MRLDEGVAFEASVVNELWAVAGSDWVFIDEAASPGLQVEATTPAIAAEAAVVVGARLPHDAAAARSGMIPTSVSRPRALAVVRPIVLSPVTSAAPSGGAVGSTGCL